MSIDSILQNPAFHSLEPARVEALKGVMVRLEGKSVTESLPIVMEFMKKLPAGHELSRGELNAMAEAILAGLPEGDRNRFKAMLKMMGV